MGVPYGYPKMDTVIIMENPIIIDGLGVLHLSSDQTPSWLMIIQGNIRILLQINTTNTMGTY